MQRPSQQKLLKNYQGKDPAPNLDRALRRAAAFGPACDVEALLAFGANKHGVDSQGKTCLHLAIEYGNIRTIPLLIRNNLSLTVRDESGKTPQDYAARSENPHIKDHYGHNAAQYLCWSGVLINVVKHLDLDSAKCIALISAAWAASVRADRKNRIATLGQDALSLLSKLDSVIRAKILKHLYQNDDKTKEKLGLFFEVLRQSDLKEKRKRIAAAMNIPLPEKIEDTHAYWYMIIFGILTPEQISANSRFNNVFAAIMLEDKLITLADGGKFRHSGSIHGPHDNLGCLFTKNGFLAVREKLIDIDDAPFHQDLKGALTDKGMELLRSGTISSKLIAAMCRTFYHFHMFTLTSDKVFSLLKSKQLSFGGLDPTNKDDVALAIKLYSHINIISHDDCLALLSSARIDLVTLIQIAEHLTKENICYLKQILESNAIPCRMLPTIPRLNTVLTTHGITALFEGLITWQQLSKHAELSILLCDNGLTLLRDGWLTVEDAVQIADCTNSKINRVDIHTNNLKRLITDTGVQAIKDNVVSLADAKKYSLSILDLPNALAALKERLISLEQASKFHGYGSVFQARSLKILLENIELLREGIITPEDAAEFYHSGSISGHHDHLNELLNPIGQIALRRKLITIKDACVIPELAKLFNPKNPDIITALECGVITPDDFKYGNKCSSWGGKQGMTDMVAFTKACIAHHMKKLTTTNESSNADPTKSAIKIQSVCKMHLARRQLGLFRHISHLLKTGAVNLGNLDAVQQASEATSKGQISKAIAKLNGVGLKAD